MYVCMYVCVCVCVCVYIYIYNTTNFSILYVWGKLLTHAALHPFAMGSAGALSLLLVVDAMEYLIQSISINFFQNSEVHYKCPNIYCL